MYADIRDLDAEYEGSGLRGYDGKIYLPGRSSFKEKEVTARIQEGWPVVLYRYGEFLVWATEDDALAAWEKIRPYFGIKPTKSHNGWSASEMRTQNLDDYIVFLDSSC